MSALAKALFIVVGLFNALPVIGVLGAGPLAALYGQTITDPDLLLLMRHRAVLFGLMGGLLVVAAFRPTLRTVATVAGVASMASFCALAWPVEVHGEALQRVFWADILAIPVLVLGWRLGRSRATHST